MKVLDELYGQARDSGNFAMANQYLAAYKGLQTEKANNDGLLKDKDQMVALVVTDASGNPIDVTYTIGSPTNTGGFLQTDKEISGVKIWLSPNTTGPDGASATLGNQVFTESSGIDPSAGLQAMVAGGQRKGVFKSNSTEPITSNNLQIRTYIYYPL